jgi:hypothetical protein
MLVVNTLTFAHVLFAIIGFGGVLLSATYAKAARAQDTAGALAILDANEQATKYARIGIWLSGLFGLVLATQIEGAFKEMWLSISMLLFIILVIDDLVVVRPATRRAIELRRESLHNESQVEPPDLVSLDKRAAAVSGANHLLFAVILVLMIFKPGAGT